MDHRGQPKHNPGGRRPSEPCCGGPDCHRLVDPTFPTLVPWPFEAQGPRISGSNVKRGFEAGSEHLSNEEFEDQSF